MISKALKPRITFTLVTSPDVCVSSVSICSLPLCACVRVCVCKFNFFELIHETLLLFWMTWTNEVFSHFYFGGLVVLVGTKSPQQLPNP